jgi:tRNA pseudouridine55 synthase
VPQHANVLHGLLVVDKPGRAQGAPGSDPQSTSARTAGTQRLPTSHDVVQMVRRWSHQRRIGHTGTLDPMASGVLVLCLGNATRLVEYYQNDYKQYYAEIVLGAATDTYDAEGQVVATMPVPPLNAQNIIAVLHQFRGTVLQSPPVYSALKQGGESVHRKARRGEDVVLRPRPVTFERLDLLHFETPGRIALRVRCSAGAYIRSLAHDIGQALGTLGYLSVLRREAVGRFSLDQAHTLATIEQAAHTGRWSELLLPMGYGLAMPAISLDDTSIQRFGFGQRVQLPVEVAGHEAKTELVQALDQAGRLVGILRNLGPAQNGGNIWKAEKWFEREA